jgi:hypothetical protein
VSPDGWPRHLDGKDRTLLTGAPMVPPGGWVFQRSDVGGGAEIPLLFSLSRQKLSSVTTASGPKWSIEDHVRFRNVLLVGGLGRKKSETSVRGAPMNAINIVLAGSINVGLRCFGQPSNYLSIEGNQPH